MTLHLRYAAPLAVDGLVHLLDEAELARLGRLRQQAGRDAFASGRLLARLVAAELTDRDAADVRIDSTCPRCGRPHGKALVAGSGAPELSIAHGDGVVAVLLGPPGTPVGLDLEPWTSGPDLVPAVDTVLSLDEVDAWDGSPAALVRAWVLKEALLKARGEGLLADPAGITLDPATPPPGTWLAEVTDVPGHAAAVARLGPQRPDLEVRAQDLGGYGR